MDIAAIWSGLPDIVKLVPGIAAAIGLVIGAHKRAYKKGFNDGKLVRERDGETLERLYGPLVALFVNVHLTSSSSVRYSTLGRRLEHAIEVLLERRYIKAKVRGFWFSLFDKGISEPTVEVEYGDSYPTAQIGKILKAQAHLAPPKLLQLYRRVARDEIEEGLSAAHLDLVNHIYAQHEQLTKKIQSA